jgi:hypothetical protein
MAGGIILQMMRQRVNEGLKFAGEAVQKKQTRLSLDHLLLTLASPLLTNHVPRLKRWTEERSEVRMFMTPVPG